MKISLITFVIIPVHCFLLLMLDLLHWIENIQMFHLTSHSGLQIHQNVLYKQGIVPKLKRVEKGLKGNGTCLAQLARFLGRIKHKGGTMNKKIGPYRPVHIIFVQVHIFMVPWVGTQMGGRKFSPVQISSHQFRKAWSSKRDCWKFQKTSTKSCQAPSSFSTQLKESNTLIYASVGQQTEEKDGSEEIVWNGSCTAALIDVHLCMSFFSKDVLVMWKLEWSRWALHIDLCTDWVRTLEGMAEFEKCRGIQVRYGNSREFGCEYTVHLWAPQRPSMLTITGGGGGKVGMISTSAPSITNLGHQSLAEAQNLCGGEDIFDVNMQETRQQEGYEVNS